MVGDRVVGGPDGTPRTAATPICVYTAHPAIGLEFDGRRSATLFGEARPTFGWMRLSPSQQEARASRFYRALLKEVATYPTLDVRASFRDEEVARTIASSTGLSVDGRTVTGHAPEPAAVVRLADRPWDEITITSASRPLLVADAGEIGVKLWLDEQQAAKIGDALPPTLAAEQADASQRRTRRAAVLIALDWIVLAALILMGVLVCRAAAHIMPTVIALVIGIATAVLIGFPLQAIGKAVQRRYYDNVD